MNVVCIDADSCTKLTEGREYVRHELVGKDVLITDDSGGMGWYYADRFANIGVKLPPQPPSNPSIDSHYNFTYTLTEVDKKEGSIKIDPYFVGAQWSIGTKDPSCAIFHIFKTCARFGEKNDKAREIKAIYKSIKRLAELEGVVLE